jgi:hypothetical protein
VDCAARWLVVRMGEQSKGGLRGAWAVVRMGEQSKGRCAAANRARRAVTVATGPEQAG